VNGKGTLLTTEQCLMNPNRNPGLSKAGLESFLGEYLGARKVIWLEGESPATTPTGRSTW
jgi:agmatine deiminase